MKTRNFFCVPPDTVPATKIPGIELSIVLSLTSGLFCSVERDAPNGGRVEERSYQLLDSEDLMSAKEWDGCSSVGRVVRKRTKKGKTS